VDRISTYEVKALAQGDGFTEKQLDPASIDELLAVSATLVPPEVSAELKNAVSSDIQAGEHDIPIPLNERVLSFIELFQGRLHDFLETGMRRGSSTAGDSGTSSVRKAAADLCMCRWSRVRSTRTFVCAKARGVWQFMRAPAWERPASGLVSTNAPTPKRAVATAALNTLAGMFNGDWLWRSRRTTAAPAACSDALKAGRADGFWSWPKPKIARKPATTSR
jgi:hypothetical protein